MPFKVVVEDELDETEVLSPDLKDIVDNNNRIH